MDKSWIRVADKLPELPDVCVCETFVIACNEGDHWTRPMMYARRMVRGQTVEKWLTVGGGETYRTPDFWQPFPSTATAPAARSEDTDSEPKRDTAWADCLRPLESLPFEEKVRQINEIKQALKAISPFNENPVECVQWVKAEEVIANDYNPNAVAPPEMELLHTSIQEDGYTQPIVVWYHDGIYEVVDGFHRNRVGKEYADIRERIHGYLPVVVINNDREDKGDRIASTIRHNRARGKHKVEAMSDIVVELKRRNWSDKKIAKELGMDADEVLRLSQITGLAEMFADHDFSQAWEVDLTEEITEF